MYNVFYTNQPSTQCFLFVHLTAPFALNLHYIQPNSSRWSSVRIPLLSKIQGRITCSRQDMPLYEGICWLCLWRIFFSFFSTIYCIQFTVKKFTHTLPTQDNIKLLEIVILQINISCVEECSDVWALSRSKPIFLWKNQFELICYEIQY